MTATDASRAPSSEPPKGEQPHPGAARFVALLTWA